jgi:hypothetical protein
MWHERRFGAVLAMSATPLTADVEAMDVDSGTVLSLRGLLELGLKATNERA